MEPSKTVKEYKDKNLKLHAKLDEYAKVVGKYRKKLLYGELDDFLKTVIYKSNFEIIEVETDKDHIHLMIQYISRVSISSIVNRLKSITTFYLWQNYRLFLKHHFWKENTFWTDGYFVCSVGEASLETIHKYIQNQG